MIVHQQDADLLRGHGFPGWATLTGARPTLSTARRARIPPDAGGWRGDRMAHGHTEVRSGFFDDSLSCRRGLRAGNSACSQTVAAMRPAARYLLGAAGGHAFVLAPRQRTGEISIGAAARFRASERGMVSIGRRAGMR